MKLLYLLPLFQATVRVACFEVSSILASRKDAIFRLNSFSPDAETVPGSFFQPPNGMHQEKITLPSSGIAMQVTYSVPERNKNKDFDKPPILFLHGSFHGAWCWAELWMPYLKSKGYPAVAISWRGTGGTFAGEGVKKVKIMEHVTDLVDVVNLLPVILQTSSHKPILVAHSFGGIVAMKTLELYPELADQLGGVVIICSVPPSGNGKMTVRFLKRSLSDSWKITTGFAMKRCLKSPRLCRELFFGGEPRVLSDGKVEDFGVSDADVLRYQKYFARDSQATIDLLDLGKQLPSFTVEENGKAAFANKLPPCLVMGAKDDFLVDQKGLEETAAYFGLDQPLIVDSPHDVMLGRKWKNGVNALEDWISSTILKQTPHSQ